MEDEGKRLKGFLVSLEMTRKRKKHEGERSVFSYATDNRVAINLMQAPEVLQRRLRLCGFSVDNIGASRLA